jgi:hypothetical protein
MSKFICKTCEKIYEKDISFELKYPFRCVECLKQFGEYRHICKLCSKHYNRKFYQWELDKNGMCNKCWKNYIPRERKKEKLIVIFN